MQGRINGGYNPLKIPVIKNNPEDQRRWEVFPLDCAKAFEMRARFAKEERTFNTSSVIRE
jgi:hypothetical protein